MHKFLRDGGVLFAAEALARLAAFSVTFVISRSLGLDAVALLTVAQSIVAYATVAGDAGLGTAAVTRLSSGGAVKEIVRGTARLQVSLTLLASIVVVPFVALTSGWPLALILALTPIAIAFSTTYVLLARSDARAVAASRITGNVVTAAFGVGAATASAPLWVVGLAYPVGALAATLYANRRSGVAIRDVIGLPSWSFVRSDVSHLSGLLIYTLVVHFYSSILVILAASTRNAENLIDIALATRLLLLFSIPGQILESVLLPRYARAVGGLTRRRIIRDAGAAVLGGLGLVLAVVGTAPWYVPILFGGEATRSITTVQVLLLQLPVSLLTTVLTIVLFARRQTIRLGVCYGAAAIVQVALALSLSSHGAPMMAFAIVGSEIVFAVLLMVIVLRKPQEFGQSNA